jgi:hypothetical protein
MRLLALNPRSSSLLVALLCSLPVAIALGCTTSVETIGEAPDAAPAGTGAPSPPGALPDASTPTTDASVSDAHAADHDAADAKPPPPPPPPPPPQTTTCSPIGTGCVSGPSLEYCQTFSSVTGCVSTEYRRGAQVYSCASCLDCSSGYERAYVACQGATGSCTKLAACCNVVSAVYKPSCQQGLAASQAQYLGELSCKSTLESYQQQGLCP